MGTSTVAASSPELRDLVDGLLADLPALADDLARLLASKERFYQRVEETAPERFRQVCGTVLRQVLTGIAEGQDGGLAGFRQATLDHLQVGASLTTMVSALRIFGSFVLDAALRLLTASGGGAPFVLVQFSMAIWRTVDACSELVTSAVREAGMEPVRGDARARLAALDGLLNGPIEPGFELDETARVLGLPLTGVFVVVIAGRTDSGGLAGLAEAREWRGAWRPGPDVDIGIIVADRVSDLASIRPALAGVASSVGLSAVFGDLTEVSTAVRQAQIARRSLRQGDVGVVQYGTLSLADLIVAAPVQAGDHARAVLNGILSGAAVERDMLLSTLRVWFGSGGAAKEAARQLYVHPNTVRYRLRRVQELTGLDLTNPRDVAELHVALEAVRLVPVTARQSG